jgi:serine/threonine-protein kinase RsbW
MISTTHRFRDSDSLIERVHALFEQWEKESRFHSFDEDTLHRLKLAVHEWMANLVQHANFDRRDLDVQLTVIPNGQLIHCSINDNSEGFDLDAHLTAKKEVLDAFPERGMGLLMIKSCTIDLSYQQVDRASHRLDFSVSADHDPWLNIPF